MPNLALTAKFAGLRASEGDVMAFYGPCGGGYGDPLDRPAEKVLEDLLDDFCTVEHARQAYAWWWTWSVRSSMWRPPRRCGHGCGLIHGGGFGRRDEGRTLGRGRSLGRRSGCAPQRTSRRRLELRRPAPPPQRRGIEVLTGLQSNGARIRRTGTSNCNGSLPLGAQIEIASEAAFRSYAVEMLESAGRS